VQLILAAAVLAGLTSAHGVGERGTSLQVSADAQVGRIQAEAVWRAADKVETGDGWASRLGADLWLGPLSVGGSWAHRGTSAWTKDRAFVRASVRHGPLRLLFEAAPSSMNAERYAELRLRLRGKWALIEPRAWVGRHAQSDLAWGFGCLVGVTKGVGR
jgi:hypothetical protein